MRWRLTLSIACALALVTADVTFAWLRPRPNWAELFDEAEVIAVARVVGDFVRVAHKTGSEEGRSWEFHGRLVIDEVLKGDCERPEIPLILHYGLTPSAYLQDGEMERVGRAGDGPGLAILSILFHISVAPTPRPGPLRRATGVAHQGREAVAIPGPPY